MQFCSTVLTVLKFLVVDSLLPCVVLNDYFISESPYERFTIFPVALFTSTQCFTQMLARRY